METRVLGVIPALDPTVDLAEEGTEAIASEETRGRHPSLTSLFAPKSRLAEAFRSLRTNLVFGRFHRAAAIPASVTSVVPTATCSSRLRPARWVTPASVTFVPSTNRRVS